ncbi:nuclease-related domain-containing protein [Streptomyces sp. NBC_00425]|uniref:nuclease-related domain-containing protein n=1 Tax=Streptomyces sp. NBC_00425 TaxID=2975740 RepID=UPI002E204757
MTLVLIAVLLVLLLLPPLGKAGLLAAVAVAAWRHLARPGARPRPGDPGASALDRAHELRTPLVRVATALSIPTKAGTLAARYEAGGRGEQHVAALLAELTDEGWAFLYDRRLPSGSTNIDGLALSPRGHVYVLDPKVMSPRFPVTVQNGRLLHGTRDVTGRLEGLMRGARAVHSLLSTQPVPVAIIVGRLPAGRDHRVSGARIVAAADVCDALRRMDAARVPRQRPANFLDVAARLLPPYTGR